ncbi:Proliferating cell nuclear antigen, related [Eimeria tenella]|uniref:Proliferating cell nuclear antigen, related n=1 Tax=Eimeria tenella TaxID=5802 RepID=U6KT55_EIMTE|nr:Proliferating cell nuclear antigen, related [Eimeria tenella]CDJ41302.1 Proliferating cell nuclear antigen, related [Eimeria tenella]|eukprot:XP_013232052.1 Proliferating cell nuclear antigen, related [Eimeria tenella]
MEVALLTVVQERLRIPEEPYSCVCTVDAKEFQELLRYIHSIAESVRIRGEKDSLVLSAKGENLAVTRVIHAPDMQCSESFEQDFAVRYLSNFVKGASLCERLEVAMTQGTPMRFTFPLPPPGHCSAAAAAMAVDAEDLSCLRFYVAPKIDED